MPNTNMPFAEGESEHVSGDAGLGTEPDQGPEADAGVPPESRPDAYDGGWRSVEAADEGLPSQEDVSLEEVVVSLQAEVEALRDQLLRTAAEFQNYRRRTANERSSALEYGKAEVISRFLDVFDDLRRSMEAVENPADEEDPRAPLESIRRGVSLVVDKFASELKKLGVEPIEAEGSVFDENLHDALLRQPPPEGVQPGTILSEVQRGYRLGDRVLRHSKVIVAL